MNDEDTEIEQALLDAALGLVDPARRSRFLDRVCAGDPALRARLDRLLEDDARAETFFAFPHSAEPTGEPTASASQAPEREAPDEDASEPRRIGRYRIVRRLGEGGCGVVYLAEQDEPVRRQVALKIIRRGMDTERVIARFALERQALALMNHPNIARVLDAGATEAGRPFFVMELVEGERITEFCDGRRLPLRERLELFIRVCHAVQHAHQKGIIHRDLKPSNVLVSVEAGAAVPKVIDFGVAKAISGPDAREGGTLAAEQFIGTPAYMSPEQAEPGRLDVDTRSDVYSLGALLYEMLTGRPPFDTNILLSAGLDELRRTLRDVEPPRPSALVRDLPPEDRSALALRLGCPPSALLAALRRDLDWIVLRCLAKDRQRRYATVQGLALDLERHLGNEAVAARPPGGLYRAGKVLRRHRAAFAAGGAILATLAGGFGVSTSLYLRERAAVREQTRLRAEAEDTEKITRAVYFVRDNKLEEANAVLATLQSDPERPSFEGGAAYRAVGDWLATGKRWSEVARRFAVVQRVGALDSWDSVTRDHQSYGAALLMCGDLAGFDAFRNDHARRFADVINGDAVARVLKTCLLRPPDPASLGRLRPLGIRAERWHADLAPGHAGEDWNAIPISLWRYRIGDFPGAERLVRRHYNPREHDSACHATLRALLALCLFRQGREPEARALLETARSDVERNFHHDASGGDIHGGFWYDWAFAHLLVEEAMTALVPAAP
jgi:hypothetical protein